MSLKVKIAVKPGPTGLYSFAQRLTEYLISQGVEVNSKKCDVTLVFADQVPFSDIDWQKPVVMRCAGAYWDASIDHDRKNALLRRIHKQANIVIYQSLFAKDLSEVYLGKRKNLSDRIIYNGIELPELSPRCLKLRQPPRIVAAARWRPHKRLRDVVAAFEFASLKRVNWNFVIGGLKKLPIVSNELKLGLDIAEEDILTHLLTGNVFVHLSHIDPCPNIVVEALACGCPVICTNSGGTPELVGSAGIILDTDKVDPEFKPLFYNDEAKVPIVPANLVYEAICKILNEYDSFVSRVLERRKLFDINVIGAQYLEVLRHVVS